MIKIRVTNGSDPYFAIHLDKLITQYNTEMPMPFTNRFENPKIMYLVEIIGIGGLLVDRLDDCPYRSIVQLLFVGKEHRHNGYGRQLVQLAEAIAQFNDGLLVGAYFDICDPAEFWIKQGYDRQVFLNGGLAYVGESDDVCFPNAQTEPLFTQDGLKEMLSRFCE